MADTNNQASGIEKEPLPATSSSASWVARIRELHASTPLGPPADAQDTSSGPVACPDARYAWEEPDGK